MDWESNDKSDMGIPSTINILYHVILKGSRCKVIEASIYSLLYVKEGKEKTVGGIETMEV